MSLLELKDTAKFVENQIARSHNMHAKKKRELNSITSHDGKFKSFDAPAKAKWQWCWIS